MSDALDTIRELLDRQAAPCTGPACAGEEYHLCDFGGDWSDFGQCCDSCDMAQAAASGLRIIHDKHFEAALESLGQCKRVLSAAADQIAPEYRGEHNVFDIAIEHARKTLDIIAADAKVALTACARPEPTSACCSDNPGANAGCCPDSLREERNE